MNIPFENIASTANKVYHQILNDSYPKTDEEQLVYLIDKAYDEWKCAEARFNEATDSDLIDHAIYDMLAAKTHYTYLLRAAKEKSVSR
ncbi:DUF2508 family protein [Anaerovorax odorimutans]|uniref:DUF2508 family protein n=1 Tax=Anaerovorax odorimutans TaxID=109327 RepID=UPI0003FFD257|nr:DUF2508 family protein [Anaerovorax odorimutans]